MGRIEQPISRRQWLRVGVLGTSLTLSRYLRAQGSTESPKRSAIFVFLEGGPSHLDTFDMKPEAEVGIRSEFRPIATSVPGIAFCEHLPMLAARADRFAILRGITHNLADHGIGKEYLLTGNRPSRVLKYPEYGSVVSHQHPNRSDLPSYVSIDESFVGPGYLGAEYGPLTAEKPRHGQPYQVRGVTLDDGLTVAKYRSRQRLLDDLDTAFRGYEGLDDSVRGWDRFQDQAHRIISAPRTREAFDLTREPASESVRFGTHEFGQSLLLASRLIEAGVHFVTVRLRPAEFDFDTHANNFSQLRSLLPPMDRGLAALLDRLEERGRLDSTALLVAGEFGRTPRINAQAGRDHWARAMFALMAGGRVHGGQVLGATDRTGSEPIGHGYTPDDLAASYFRNIGIDPQTQFQTNTGRPVMLVRDGQPIEDLF